MRARARYREGDWFAVPLRDEGFAVGIVARANRKGVLLGYFFGPRRTDVPSAPEIAHLRAGGALLIGMFGDLGLIEGSWPVIGRNEEWDRAEWPMPVFVRYEELTGRSFEVWYDQDDPNKLMREVQVAPGQVEAGPRDGMMGYGFVEMRLTALLS